MQLDQVREQLAEGRVLAVYLQRLGREPLFLDTENTETMDGAHEFFLLLKNSYCNLPPETRSRMYFLRADQGTTDTKKKALAFYLQRLGGDFCTRSEHRPRMVHGSLFLVEIFLQSTPLDSSTVCEFHLLHVWQTNDKRGCCFRKLKGRCSLPPHVRMRICFSA